MTNSVKISVLHVIFLSMTVIGIKNHVTILPSILEVARRDGWMSVIMAFIYILPFLFCMYMYHRTQKAKLHMAVKVVIALLVFLLCAMTMVEMLQWVHTTFLPTTPILVLLAGYFLICVVFATMGLQTIVRVNVIVLAGVVVLGFFVAFVNIQVKDYSLLLPLLEHGVLPVAKASIFPASGYIELVLLLFLSPYMKKRLKIWHFPLMAAILAGLTMGPLIGAIVEFGPGEAAKQRYPAYEEWGLAALGAYINHMDFFSVYQWLTGVFVRIGFYLFLVAELFGIAARPKAIWRYIAVPFGFICLAALLVDEQTFLYLNNYIVPIVTFSVLALFCLYIFIKSLITRKRERKSDERAVIPEH